MTKNRRAKQDARRLAEATGISYAQALREVQVHAVLQGIPTPLQSLTSYTAGWHPGQLIILGARPGGGKSAFAVNSALTALRAKRSVLFFSPEMEEDELRDRMISSLGSVPLAALQDDGPVDEATQRSIDGASTELRSAKLTVDADHTQTTASIRSKALEVAQSSDGLDLILLDGLQLIIGPEGSALQQRDSMAQISRELKELARELNVPILATAQLSRTSDGMPKLSSFRDTGAIAQDSDVVILLHREHSQDPTIQVILAKNRRGVADKAILCHADFERQTFREIKSGELAELNLEPKLDELTVWELGEHGGYWFVEGTTDWDAALAVLHRWRLETDPDHAYDYMELVPMIREDWYWEPLFADDPAGESMLRSEAKHGPSEGKSLMAGIFISLRGGDIALQGGEESSPGWLKMVL